MSTQCAYCGEGVPPHSMFCASCGQLVVSRPTAVPPPLGGGLDSTGTTPPAVRTVAPPAAVPLPPVIGGPLVPPAPPAPPAPSAPVSSPAPASASPAAPQSASVPPLSVRLPDGSTVAITSGLVLGRKPTPDIAPDGYAPVVVRDPERSTSRAHITLEPANGHALLSDLGAANGTALDHAGTRSRVTEKSGRIPVYAGDRIWMGRVAIDIV